MGKHFRESPAVRKVDCECHTTSAEVKFTSGKKNPTYSMHQSEEECQNEVISARSISHDKQDCIFELFIELTPP